MEEVIVDAYAFYLPQYHPNGQNDEWWGPGFSEWTSVASARRLFRGHRQPNLPGELGFYDLRLQETREQQAELARSAGVSGFVYWHYWFGHGHRVLERPFDEVLRSGSPDFPFALAWANESWSRRWNGDDRTILAEQVYPGDVDYREHFRFLLSAFRDPRYITVDGKPLFFIYRPQDLPSRAHFVDTFQRLAQEAGLPGLYLVQGTADDPRPAGFDASYAQPSLIDKRVLAGSLRSAVSAGARRAFDKGGPVRVPYDRVMDAFNARAAVAWTEHPGVMPNWDNTPRRKRGGIVLTGATPDRYRDQLAHEAKRVKASDGARILFIKSWNEWAEGNHLEPDRRYGRAWLSATRDGLQYA